MGEPAVVTRAAIDFQHAQPRVAPRAGHIANSKETDDLLRLGLHRTPPVAVMT